LLPLSILLEFDFLLGLYTTLMLFVITHRTSITSAIAALLLLVSLRPPRVRARVHVCALVCAVV